MRSMSSPSVWNDTAYFGSADGSIYAVDVQSGDERWSYNTGDNVRASVTIIPESNLVVGGSLSQQLFMLDADSGQERWTFDLGAGFSGAPTAVGESLFAFDDDGVLWRFDNPE